MCITKNKYQITKENSKRGREKQKTVRQNTISEMAIVSPYLPIITVNVSGLTCPTKGRVAGWIKKKTRLKLYTAYKRLTLVLRT